MSAAREYGLGENFEWPRPPAGGWTADDLDTLPNLPPHTELIDGSLVFMSPQTDFHMAAVRLLEYALLTHVPEHLYVVREMTTRLSKLDRLEPDLMVVSQSARTGPGQTSYAPDDVLLVVEIVSAESIARDREAKPVKYARAGIRHFWRVEENDGLPVVYVYELDPATHLYSLSDIHHKRLKLEVPFPLDVDLTALNRPGPFRTS
ncbi:Uma2 family endonuclease [Streptomyces sp. NPDC015127]|uniref:Uma2 family endonuclease n=1 Tax=Streptomyces sp. NPDC015127 TaxID=3364939 RepID=UPI0036F51408